MATRLVVGGLSLVASVLGGICFTSGLANQGHTLATAAESTTVGDAEVVTPQPAAGRHWPMFRGDSFSTGIAQTELPEQPELLWTYRVEKGAFEGTAAIVDGTVYVGDLDGKLYALDLATGELRWHFTSLEKDGFMASPTVRDGKVYVGDIFGHFYCLNAKDGNRQWSFDAQAEIDSSANFYKGNVLVGSQDATLYCLGANDGQLIWKYTIEDQIRCTPTVVEDRCFVAGCDGKLHIIDLTQGKSVASVEIESPTMSTPAVRGDLVYFGTEGGTFFCINWRDAKIVWRKETTRGKSIRSSAAASDEYIVFGDQGRQVRALQPKDGTELWTFGTKKKVDSSPVLVGGRAFVGSSDGRVYGIDLKSGQKSWEFEAGGGFSASPAVADGRLVIASDDGVIYCFGKKG